MPLKLLAFDTSNDTCSCCLYLEGAMHVRSEVVPRKHAELLLEMVVSLLAEGGAQLSELDALAFGRGPGSFTGLRIASGVAQGLAHGQNLPVVPVSSLRALAEGGRRQFGWTHAHCLFDARMGEVYAGSFAVDATGLMAAVTEERVCPPEDLALETGPQWHGAGAGWTAYAELLGDRFGLRPDEQARTLDPQAHDVAMLAVADHAAGLAVRAAEAVPVYLRNKVALTRAEREAGKV
ncbi:MAG: tRNA (adenosine(37)-N6)-threonylcarbamoyltransferase complex dimerization subunit type 1 TsaB [Pseudomonadota bacterium]